MLCRPPPTSAAISPPRHLFVASPASPLVRARRKALLPVLQATPSSSPSPQPPSEPDDDNDGSGGDNESSSLAPGSPEQTPGGEGVERFNPVTLGRRARRFLDDFASGLTQVSQIFSSSYYAEEALYSPGAVVGLDDLQTPQAPFTTVLVTGATGRVGRIVVRKLLLRGYTVRALVRESSVKESADLLPPSVHIIKGDITDPEAVARAVQGCNKIICCSASRIGTAKDIMNVEKKGVANLIKAQMDWYALRARKRAGKSKHAKLKLCRLKSEADMKDWDVQVLTQESALISRYVSQKALSRGEMAISEEYKTKHAIFEGAVRAKGSAVEANMSIDEAVDLSQSEGLVARVYGDGKTYTIFLDTKEGDRFSVPVTTKEGWQTLRLPYAAFRDRDGCSIRFDENQTVFRVGFRYEQPKMRRAISLDKSAATNGSSLSTADMHQTFRLGIMYIKSLPKRSEPDFVLVSCAGHGLQRSRVPDDDKSVSAKKIAENQLRNSGLGYTIIRPGSLLEEAGGNRALVFDQGNRLQRGISCADVADVCIQALHDDSAVNKSFDVCYEYVRTTDGVMDDGGEESIYELITNVPNSSGNYLTAALRGLEKNT